jgi:hypothetical protein
MADEEGHISANSDDDLDDFDIPSSQKLLKSKSTYGLLPWTEQMQAMLLYHTKTQYPFPDMDKEKKRNFRRLASRYLVIDGHLHLKKKVKPNKKDSEGIYLVFRAVPFVISYYLDLDLEYSY